MYKHIVKRLIDIFLSGIAIIILAIPMLIIAIAIEVEDPVSMFFYKRKIEKRETDYIF